MKTLLVYVLVAAGLLAAAGCQTAPQHTAAPDHATSVASGQGFIADALVTVFDAAGKYVTKQQYHVSAQPPSIRITAQEPQGLSVWQWPGGQTPQPQQAGPAAKRLGDPYVLHALTAAALAGAEMMDTSAGNAMAVTRVEGQWYEPVVFDATGGATLTLYKDPRTGRFERARLHDAAAGRLVAVRSYNFLYIAALARIMPTKFDVLVGPTESALTRVLQIEYTAVH